MGTPGRQAVSGGPHLAGRAASKVWLCSSSTQAGMRRPVHWLEGVPKFTSTRTSEGDLTWKCGLWGHRLG